MEEEERRADEEFWQQEAFQEEAVDQDYAATTDDEDVADSDFSAPEDSEDDDEGVEGTRDDQPRKKKLLPPGSHGRSARKKRPADKSVAAPKAKRAKSPLLEDTDKPVHSPPVLRKSTIERRAEAAQERLRQEQLKEKRKKPPDTEKYRPLTQAELLKEAAQTELKNLADLKELVAREEETKKRAMVTKTRYTGPLVRVKSAKVGGLEKTTVELCNMQHVPSWLEPQVAPKPAKRSVCAVTGLPAKYRDPLTGIPYATPAAFKILRQRGTRR
eukprot:evm.model.scf_65.17 EVM.evm.TU.scf_65.17   scf_65:124137-128253(-)